jgi:hypothetical protein
VQRSHTHAASHGFGGRVSEAERCGCARVEFEIRRVLARVIWQSDICNLPMAATLEKPLIDSGDDAHTGGKSVWEMIQKAADKFMHYVSLTCMFVLPGFLEERPNGHAILFSILTAVSLSVLLGTAVQRYCLRSIKMWPKFLDVGTLAINAGLLIYTQASGKSAEDLASFLQAWGGFIQNVALLCTVLVTLLVGMPFTMQIAKETVSEAHWNSPVFSTINYHVTFAWAAVFAVETGLCLMGIFVYPYASSASLPPPPPPHPSPAAIATGPRLSSPSPCLLPVSSSRTPTPVTSASKCWLKWKLPACIGLAFEMPPPPPPALHSLCRHNWKPSVIPRPCA